MNMVVASSSVAPHVQQTVMACYEAGYLNNFYTSFFEHPDNKLSASLKKIKPITAEINRRSFHNIPIEKFVSRPMPELLRSIAARKLSPLITDRIWEWAELGFDNWVASKLNNNIDAIYTYEHAALAMLKKARQLNMFSIYEQSSQHHTFFNQIVAQQFSLYPELKTASTQLLVNNKAIKRNQRRDEELALASLIICNSSFTKKTLIAGGIDAEKISVVPLAFPAVNTVKKQLSPSGRKTVIFLYAGNQSVRKASHLLYEAWRKCNFSEQEAELWLIGKMTLPEHLRQRLPGKVIIKDNIPHTELNQYYTNADVFILPTLADGFGMVVTEAMACGLPVIASENSCGPDVIEHMHDGWVIPAGNADAIIKQMKWCVSNQHMLHQFGIAAQTKAAEWQWPQYRKKLTEVIYNKWQKFRQTQASV